MDFLFLPQALRLVREDNSGYRWYVELLQWGADGKAPHSEASSFPHLSDPCEKKA